MISQDTILEVVKYSKKLRLLYVEDNDIVRESTTKILDTFFGEITVSKDGVLGLDEYRKHTFDIVITDINMPNMDGINMVKHIREIDTTVPILMLSAHNEPEYFTSSIKYDVEGYLLKPIDMQQFLSVLIKIIDKMKLKDELSENLNFLNQYQAIADTGSIVSKTDVNGVITYVNENFINISGYSREELIGANHNIVRHPDVPNDFFRELWHVIKYKKEIWQGIVKNYSKDHKSYYVQAIITPILNNDGEIIEYISSRNDITDVMNPTKQLEGLIESVDEAFVVMIQIEEFTSIKKFYGQVMASKIEVKFATTIFEYIPKECDFDRIFSLGYGKYALAKDNNASQEDTQKLIKCMKDFQNTIYSAELNLGEIDYDVSIIISISYGKNALENARYGLRELKETKQNFIVANDIAQNERNKAQQNLRMIKMIKKAIDTNEIISYFQPIVNNETKEIEKYESLVRLKDENGEILLPLYFLDIAKDGKYYSQITALVLKNSFEALHKCNNKEITINLSTLDIEKESTRDEIIKLLEQYRSDSHRIVFELLENENSIDFDTIRKFILEIKTYNVKIAVDDFGAGYSNFIRLLDYKPDILKIDGSLIKNILTDKFSLDLVETIVTFAKKQDIKTVGEFVESEELFNKIKEIGVDYSQGYWFGKPKPF